MAYNNGYGQMFNGNMSQPQNFQQQNVQPLFPQPQGNVYNINSTLEVANVPCGAGISVALCMNEKCMYIKSLQNGSPMFWAYKIIPYDENQKTNEQVQTQEKPNLSEQFMKYDARFDNIENQIGEIKTAMNNKGGDWKI